MPPPILLAMMLVVGICCVTSSPATGLAEWQQAHPRPETDGLKCIVFGADRWVGVGLSGKVAVSFDGESWAAADSGTYSTLYSVVWDGAQFMAVGDTGAIATSSDGFSWSSHWSGTLSTLRSVACGGGRYVAVGENLQIILSMDGVSWVNAGNGSGTFMTVAYGRGVFAVAGWSDFTHGVLVLTSVDGEAWIRQSVSPMYPSKLLFDGVTQQFHLFSHGYEVATSHDARAWTTHYRTNWVFDAVVTPTGFVGIQYDDTFSSGDGINWVRGSAGPNLEGWANLRAINYGGGRYHLLTDRGVYTSTTAANWTTRSFVSPVPIRRTRYVGNRFIALGYYGVMLSSPDGSVWERFSVTNPDAQWLHDVAFGNGLYVAVGNDGAIFTSADFIHWTHQESTVDTIDSLTFGGGTFVGINYSGVIISSNDGTNWVAALTEPQGLRQITYGGSLFVAVGNYGAILTSPDAATWTRRDAGTDDSFYAVTHENGLFIAGGHRHSAFGAGFATSSDGTNWTYRVAALSDSPYLETTALAFSHGLFVAGGCCGVVLSSADGVTWNEHPFPQYSLDSLASDGSNAVVALVNGDTLLTSSAVAIGTPVIQSGPTNTVVAAGTRVVLGVDATGPPPLHYQWLKDGATIDQGTNATLVFEAAASHDSGTYSVVVSNAYGVVLSGSAVLRVNPHCAPLLAVAQYIGVTIVGYEGSRYTIEATTDIAATNTWAAVTNFVLPRSPYLWIDLDSPTGAKRYYRAVLSP